MPWKIAQAKQHLSDVIRRAAREPQVILNRDRPVAAIIAAEDLADYTAWKKGRTRKTLAEHLEEMRRICEEENYVFEPPPRFDRPNPFVPAPRRGSRRHQRRQ